MGRSYSIDFRKKVIDKYLGGMSKNEIVSFFSIAMTTLNSWIKKYKETGSLEVKKQTKYRARRFSDEDLKDFIEKNPSSTLEDIAKHFSVSLQSIFRRLKMIGVDRRKKLSSAKKEQRKNKSVH